MRQGQQQNRRGRGRGGRKPLNPLSRNYESNGPDVKIRGTAAHVAEKYVSLARDALASGDIVQAENYLQHAEHYNRIIMAAQTPFPGQPNEGPNGASGPRQRTFGLNTMDEDGDGDGDGDGDDQPNTQPTHRHESSRQESPRQESHRQESHRQGGFERRQGRGDGNGRGRGSSGGGGNTANGSEDAPGADEGALDGSIS